MKNWQFVTNMHGLDFNHMDDTDKFPVWLEPVSLLLNVAASNSIKDNVSISISDGQPLQQMYDMDGLNGCIFLNIWCRLLFVMHSNGFWLYGLGYFLLR